MQMTSIVPVCFPIGSFLKPATATRTLVSARLRGRMSIYALTVTDGRGSGGTEVSFCGGTVNPQVYGLALRPLARAMYSASHALVAGKYRNKYIQDFYIQNPAGSFWTVIDEPSESVLNGLDLHRNLQAMRKIWFIELTSYLSQPDLAMTQGMWYDQLCPFSHLGLQRLKDTCSVLQQDSRQCIYRSDFPHVPISEIDRIQSQVSVTVETMRAFLQTQKRSQGDEL